MAKPQPFSRSPSVSLEIEPPDIDTPTTNYGANSAFSAHLQTYFPTPYHPQVQTPHVSGRPISSAQMDNVHSDNQSLAWEAEAVHSSPEGSRLNLTASTPSQCELPRVISTPARDLTQLARKTQEGWDKMHEEMEGQSLAIKELTVCLIRHQNSSNEQAKDLVAQISANHRQIFEKITSNKEIMETEMDKIVKGVKLMLEEELKDSQTSLLSGIHFMIEQLQVEIQQDLKSFHTATEERLCKLSEKIQASNSEQMNLTANLGKVEVESKERLQSLEQKTSFLKERLESLMVESNATPSPASSSAYPLDKQSSAAVTTSAMIKSDHIKLTFPTYGTSKDDPDPLTYLAKCHDFLALHPLSNAEILATFRTVLHGTARDWWEIARSTVTTWSQFETVFLAAFLSEDYEDELAERVRTRRQQEKETIRDFAFSYRALCKRWNPTLTEASIVKMILKNIKPLLASQLRGRAETVEDLVRLGHQLERDYEQHMEYNQRMGARNIYPFPKNTTSAQPGNEARHLVLCWRCQGNHPPGSCPHYHSPGNFTNSHQQQVPKYPPRPPKPKGLPGNGSVSVVKSQKPVQPRLQRVHEKSTVSNTETTCKPLDSSSTPHQLLVPISIDTWRGKAIVDTGASYTLIHEYLWMELKGSKAELQPWAEGPLYLANGEATTPIGWENLSVELQGQVSTLPTVVLGSEALAYGMVLGLDFICSVGMIINVADKVYSFKSNPPVTYPFQPGSAHPPGKRAHENQSDIQTSKTNPLWNISLISSVPPPILSLEPVRMEAQDYINLAVSDAHLQDGEKKQLRQLLESNPQVCTNQPGKTDILQHTIYTTNCVPIKQRPYRMNPGKQAIVKDQLRDMIAAGVVEPSYSAWASPVVLPPKKDGGHRFCVDFRKVNAVTETDAYPLPNINEILESLSGASLFSTIDLNSGYWQVPMDPCSKAKTAFVTHSGLYHFNVMPFGLKNAPATFQRLMEKVLEGLRGEICLVYLDDIIIYSSSVTQHFERLRTVIDRLQKANLTINLKKSRFCLQELRFLGHIVSGQGVSADPDKVEAIKSYPAPTNLKEVQRFLGLAGWYHKFVPDFSKIAEPLNDLKKKGRSFFWSQACQNSFDKLKSSLISPPILGHPNLNLPFFVYTDASNTGLGAVLTQRADTGSEVVLAYASRTLNRAEINYSVTEKECLAIIWALERWQHYLEPNLFTVITDHSALKWVLSSTKTTSRLIRWALRLQRFDFIVEYRKGKLNGAPDALSRIPPFSQCCLYSNQTEGNIPISLEKVWEEQQ